MWNSTPSLNYNIDLKQKKKAHIKLKLEKERMNEITLNKVKTRN